LLHELAHKVVAQRYGYWAEFRADPQMLVIAVVSGAVGFLFAAPGAVRIYSYGNREIKKSESGIISVAGPVTNLLLFGVFLVISLVAGSFGMPILAQVSFFGMFINAFLAAFNMIPFGPLDGRSVMDWNRLVFGIVFLISAALAIMTMTSFNISQVVR
ncbi:MAG: metalloprotease, partial [Halobacteria archaeon]|nr:metalloprotease [Halobacteria archaeon]